MPCTLATRVSVLIAIVVCVLGVFLWAAQMRRRDNRWKSAARSLDYMPDVGGSFLLDGRERVVIAYEERPNNSTALTTIEMHVEKLERNNAFDELLSRFPRAGSRARISVSRSTVTRTRETLRGFSLRYVSTREARGAAIAETYVREARAPSCAAVGAARR